MTEPLDELSKQYGGFEAGQYVKFEDERTRPVRDLLAAVPPTPIRTAVDLGCGPGNSTEVLAARAPSAAIHGLDVSADMIELAGEASATLSKRTLAQRRTAIDDHPGRLALSVGVDDPHGA